MVQHQKIDWLAPNLVDVTLQAIIGVGLGGFSARPKCGSKCCVATEQDRDDFRSNVGETAMINKATNHLLETNDAASDSLNNGNAFFAAYESSQATLVPCQEAKVVVKGGRREENHFSLVNSDNVVEPIEDIGGIITDLLHTRDKFEDSRDRIGT